ncbi:hypothetical protein PUN28_010745 [Cardiocondyla obscurior]|uniref:Uncharacterized protein n=1 Tax=Cardiocondyla obscurior TaxID=286306 RepID=A0AAW2FK71_9HYME
MRLRQPIMSGARAAPKYLENNVEDSKTRNPISKLRRRFSSENRGRDVFECAVLFEIAMSRRHARVPFSIFVLFVKRRGAHEGGARMQNGRDDPSNALFYRQRYSCKNQTHTHTYTRACRVKS